MAWKTIAGVIQKNTTDDKIRLIIEGEAVLINEGVNDFSQITGNPMDNPALADDLTRIEAKADVAQDDIDAHELRNDNPHGVTKSQIGLSKVQNINPLVSQGFSIFDDNFEDGVVSSEFTLSTGWSTGTDGIAISSNGGWGNSAIFNKYTTIDRVSTRALVEIINTSSVFSIIRKPNFGLGQFGTVAEVNCSTNQLRLFASWDGSTSAPSVIKTVSIPFSIVANRKYLVELIKNKGIHVFKFTDVTTPVNTIELTYNNSTETSSGAGRQWAAPGLMFISGSIKLKRFTYATQFRSSPKVLITGHSFVEGYALINEGDDDKSYSNLLFEELAGKVAIAGRGGENISTLNTREDINYFSPVYHMVDIGSNDTVYSTWLAGIQDYIVKIIGKNATPILCTIVPRADRQSFINQANTWIRSSGYNYIDFAKAVTLGNDGITQNPALFAADQVHPNIAGNAKMLMQIKIDAPYLWDGIKETVQMPLDYIINSATNKTTPLADADVFALLNSATSNALNKISWSNIKASIKSWVETITTIFSLISATKATFGGSAAGNAHITIAAPTSTIATEQSAWGAPHTGTNAGAEWKETTDYRKRILRDGLIDEYVFMGKNKALSSINAINFIITNADGSFSVGGQVLNREVTDTDIISAINSASWVDNRATITPIGGKVMLTGRTYSPTTGAYNYVAQADNIIRRY